MKQQTPAAPKDLSPTAAAWWSKLLIEYQINDSAGLMILEQALRSFDRAEEARRLIDKEGAVVLDRFKQARQHPACQIERDSRAALVKTLGCLGIDGGPNV